MVFHREAAAILPLFICAALTLTSAPLPAAAADAPHLQCPGVATWYTAHPQETDAAMLQRDAARTFTDPVLRAELDERFTRDQAARNALLSAGHNRSLTLRALEVDADNVAWLFKLVQRTGFPTAAQVGERGVRHAWLLAQHADRQPTFQAALLPALEQRHAEGELDGATLARFVDRILVAQHQPQRYGTQFSSEAWATSYFGLPDAQSLAAIEANRRALGIMPLADYVCMTTLERQGKY